MAPLTWAFSWLAHLVHAGRPSARQRSAITGRFRAPLRGWEPLESRYALAAAGLEDPVGADQPALVSSQAAPVAAPAADLTALLLRISGRELWVQQSETQVVIAPGATLEVAGARIDVAESLVAVGGVLQIEGYLRSGGADGDLGEFDYTSGLFSAALPVAEAVADVVHGGLAGQWTVTAQHNRLSVVLVHYVGDEVTATDRFFVQLQTAAPDFVVTGDVGGNSHRTFRVGQLIQLMGQLDSAGDGAFSTYIEADVYHQADLTTPVWVGTLSGTTSSDGPVRGHLRNDNDQDGFEKFWRSDRAGTYLIKLYVDPENNWLEANEDNNVFVFQVVVAK